MPSDGTTYRVLGVGRVIPAAVVVGWAVAAALLGTALFVACLTVAVWSIDRPWVPWTIGGLMVAAVAALIWLRRTAA